MKFTESTKLALAQRRFIREYAAKGYEEVGEGGGKLWQLYRGGRTNCRIVDAKIPPAGRSIWVKIEAEHSPIQAMGDRPHLQAKSFPHPHFR